ncbi:MAG TPA: hypothetical protein VIS72_18600, partial [Anaerolineales bacterium]
TTLASTDSVTFTAILSKNAKKKKEIVGLVVHAFGTLIKIADFKKALANPLRHLDNPSPSQVNCWSYSIPTKGGALPMLLQQITKRNGSKFIPYRSAPIDRS